MADTERTTADMIANLFQDGQPAGSISPQDMRDFVLSAAPVFGKVSMQSNTTATTISVAGTYTKVLGTTAISTSLHKVDDGGGIANRLRYTGTPTRHVEILAGVSFTVGTNNQVVGFKFWHFDASAGSGSYLAPSLLRRKVGTGADVGAVTIQDAVAMDTNDYIELHVTNESGTAAVTVEELNFKLTGHLF